MTHATLHIRRVALFRAAAIFAIATAACGSPDIIGSNPILEQVVLTPSSVTLQSGATRQFTVSGVWSDGGTTAPAVTYSATGGTISSGGLYTAGSSAGSFRVIATQQGGSLADTSAVTVTAAPPTLTQVILTPATVSLPAGLTQQFAVSGRLSDGSNTTPSVNYTATGGTITAGGLYTAGSTTGTFRVIAVQQGGTLADTSAVTITAAVLTQVILTPATTSLPAGRTQQFAVSGKLSTGATTTPSVTYSGTGGSITAGGLYTAGSTTGTFRVIAVQQGGTLADTSTVTITAAVLTQVILTPSAVGLAAGATQQFTVSGTLSTGATTTPAVIYSATGGAITAGGLYTAGSTTGAFRVIAVQQGGTLADTSAVTITAAVLTQVILTPATVSLPAGLTQQFAVSGMWSDGSTTAPSVSYSATGGTITAGGLYTAGNTTGTFRVIAVQQGGTLADTSAVTITAAVLTQVILTPSTVTLAASATQQFTVSGTLSTGATTTPAVIYSATGGAITTGGFYTAGSTAGTFRVIAVQQGGTLADTSAVTITATPPTLTQVILTPAAVSLVTGGTQQFTASGMWSDGSTTPPAVNYSATGGTITTGGLYTAGSTAGSFRVIAVQQGGTLADTSVVTITAGRSYTTNFPLTENPISEGGNWTGGFTPGLKWSDVQTTPGLAFGRQQIDWARSYSDGTALLTGAWSPNQQATATVHSAGAAPDNYYEEVELRLRSAISANSNTGYEVSFKVSSNSSAYLIVVRWNGPWGSFDYLPGGGSGSTWGVKDGDVISAKIVGNIISVYKNGTLVSTTDITATAGAVFTSGAPGMGFNLESPGTGHNSDYGFSSFTATDLP